MREPDFLPGVPADLVMAALSAAGGKEIESGKFANPESSAALAANAFGWFINRPSDFPPFPGLELIDWPATSVTIERCLRFPWRGGRHPWLDAVVETSQHLIGIESKRFEPYRDRKLVSLSPAYDRPVWGAQMGPFEKMRDDLRAGRCRFDFLDAAQLVKHAFGIVTQATAMRKKPVLFYLFAEPEARAGKAISRSAFEQHRAEVANFAARTDGAAVRFLYCSYSEWLAGFIGLATAHADALRAKFAP